MIRLIQFDSIPFHSREFERAKRKVTQRHIIV